MAAAALSLSAKLGHEHMPFLGLLGSDGIVIAAKELGWSFGEVYRILSVISRAEGLGEATDTAVREYVYEALENV